MRMQQDIREGQGLAARRPRDLKVGSPGLFAKPVTTGALLAAGTLAAAGMIAALLPTSIAPMPRFEPAMALRLVERPAPRRAGKAFVPMAPHRLAIVAGTAMAYGERELDRLMTERFTAVSAMPAPIAATTPGPAMTAAAPAPVSAVPDAPAAAPATRIVYLVDASGSLLDSLPQVIDWLGESLEALEKEQQFTIVFFREGATFEAPPIGMKPATFTAKSAVFSWIQPEKGHVVPQGKSDLMAALRTAMRYEPDEVYVLTDDSFSRAGAIEPSFLLTKLAAALGHAPPRVNTVQFFYRDEAGALEAISDKFGGRYEFIAPLDPQPTAHNDPLFNELSILN